MKLYVWKLGDVTNGAAFALATNEDEARQLIVENSPYENVRQMLMEGDLSKPPQVYDKPAGFLVEFLE